jgi:glucosamine kinase
VAYFLGVDGGGSKTTCALGDETSRLATVTTGASNITRVGEECARESLRQAIRLACEAAKIDPGQVQRACIGIAGAGREEVASAVRKTVADLIPAEIEVVGDMQIALEAAFDAGPGVIVIAGTGSIAYGRDAQGRTARAGGWGFAISDEGSAHWIGRAAVAALLRAVDQTSDGRNATETSPLFCEVKAAWSLHSLDALVGAANSRPDFATLFPAVLAAADAGDTLAADVLAHAGRELAQLAGIAVCRIFGEDDAMSIVRMAVAGGVFDHSPRVRETFRKEVCRLNPRVELNSQVVDPVEGALRIARRATLSK